MIIATWNLNNRVGKVRFRREAAQAAITVEADLIVFTEFYPQQNEEQFRYTLEQAGWQHQMISNESTEIANRILIASRIPLLPLDIEFPDFDQQFPSNLLGVTLPSVGLTVLGVRVPAYHGNTVPLLFQAWQWLEATAASLKIKPTVILGDLNVAITSNRGRAGDYFRRILANGWYRATPSDSPTFFSHTGRKTEIDHILASSQCIISSAKVLQKTSGFSIAGFPDAISDHAILQCNIEIYKSDNNDVHAQQDTPADRKQSGG